LTALVTPTNGDGTRAMAGADQTTADPVRFLIGDWVVDVSTRRLQRADEVAALEPLPMAVLVELCRRPNEVVSAEHLLDACWSGEASGDNPVHKVIAGLRRALGDSATAPTYIETIRRQGYRLVAPLRVLSGHGPRSHQGGWRRQCPFRGLEPFQAQHASVFFGRDAAVAMLHARLTEQWRRGNPLMVLLGPSGCGKTSLVQAGLLPAMTATPPPAGDGTGSPTERLYACATATLDLAVLSDLDPWSAMAGAMLDWENGATPLLAGYSIETLAAALQDPGDAVLRQLRIGLDACPAAQAPSGLVAPPVLVLDRIEALFQPGACAHAEAFIECVDRFVHSRLLTVVAICRNDFYPSLAQHPPLMRGKEHGAHMDLAPPDGEAIAQMIRLPARAAGLLYGTDASGMNRLDDRLCADAMHSRDALPLLQYTLHALYQNRAPGNELTWQAYQDLGGLEGAIGGRAEAVLSALPQRHQDALSRLLPRLVGVSTIDADPTSRWAAASELQDDEERALVEAFVSARLLVADHVAGVTGYRVAHDALLRRWPRVTSWLAQHRATLATREQLQPWVRRWVDGGCPGALLLPRAALLWQASRALADKPSLFGDDERRFVHLSLARARRHKRWRWAASAATLALGVASGVAAVRYADLARLAAQRERQSQRLAAFMLGDLADQLRPVGKLDLLGRIGEQGLSLLGQGTESADTPMDTLQRAKALVVIGEVYSSRGKGRIDTAAAALRQAGRLLEPLEHQRGFDTAEFYKTLGASAFWLGQIAFDVDDLDAAAHEMSRYRAACERWLAQLPEDPQAKAELGFALNSLGSIAFKRGQWAQAGQWFEASLAMKLAVLQRDPQNADSLDAVASSRIWLGQVAHVQGRSKEALALYDAARVVQSELLARHPLEAVRLRDLGVLAVRRAEVLHAMGRHMEAAREMGDAVQRLEQASGRDPSNLRWRAEKLHAESGLLIIEADAGMGVRDRLAAMQQHMTRMGDATGSHDDLRQETLVRMNVLQAELAARSGDWTSAMHLGAKAHADVLKLLQSQSHNWQVRELQARLGLLDMRAHAAEGRIASCARTREALEPVVRAGQAGVVLEAWLLARACSGAGSVTAEEAERLTSGGYRAGTNWVVQRSQTGR
jgi:DNA-binding winged helix-turn-helix (wHTH) protein/tetratricopeptide (TPR) repeat protein